MISLVIILKKLSFQINFSHHWLDYVRQFSRKQLIYSNRPSFLGFSTKSIFFILWNIWSEDFSPSKQIFYNFVQKISLNPKIFSTFLWRYFRPLDVSIQDRAPWKLQCMLFLETFLFSWMSIFEILKLEQLPKYPFPKKFL